MPRPQPAGVSSPIKGRSVPGAGVVGVGVSKPGEPLAVWLSRIRMAEE